MRYDLKEFEKLVEEGYVRRVEKDGLVLYNYTDKCTYDRKWDTKYTRDARGIIFEEATGVLIAKPFPKFFNLGEMEETQLLNLPDCPYEVTEKVDGSLGILYYYRGEWRMATRGSFDSEQAAKGLEIFKKTIDANFLAPNCTYLFEIVYPENKIVVNYGQQEKLVLLGIYNVEINPEGADISVSGRDLRFQHQAAEYSHSIHKMIELQKTMPKDQEGFVVKYATGLRVKIKGEEYLKIHKMISNMTPLSFWESMENGKVNREYLAQLPEEFKSDFEPIVAALEEQYVIVRTNIVLDSLALPCHGTDRESLKTIGLFLKHNVSLEHGPAMFPYILGNTGSLNKYIMKKIRPDGNVLKF